MQDHQVKKKILLLSYCFPPMSDVGGRRTLGFTKYLTRFHIEPVVLTRRTKYYRFLDIHSAEEIPKNTAIYRTFSLDFKSYFTLIKKNLKSPQINPSNNVNSSFSDQAAEKSKIFNFFKFLEYLVIPDLAIFWLPFAFLASMRIFAKHKISAIFVTAPPFSSLLLGVVLKILFRKPLISDFRDPWIPLIEKDPNKNAFSKFIEKHLEKAVIKRSDHVVFTSRRAFEHYQKRYGHLKNAKQFSVIFNGFHPETIRYVEQMVFDKFTIVYTGTLYEARTSKYFLDVYHQFIVKNNLSNKDIQLLIYGTVANSEMDYIKEKKLEQFIRVQSAVPYYEMLQILKGADLLLLIVGSEHYLCIPAKLYDYLASSKPILALVPEESEVLEIITKTNSGSAIYSWDKEKAVKALEFFYVNKKENFAFNDEAIKEYDFLNSSKKLADLLFNSS